MDSLFPIEIHRFQLTQIFRCEAQITPTLWQIWDGDTLRHATVLSTLPVNPGQWLVGTLYVIQYTQPNNTLISTAWLSVEVVFKNQLPAAKAIRTAHDYVHPTG